MTIRQMKYLLGRNGNDYFAENNIEMFDSKIEIPPDNNGFLVESTNDLFSNRRLYMVKSFTSEGDIRTIEPAKVAETYEHFPSLDEAKSFMTLLTKAVGGFGLSSSIKEVAVNSGEFIFRNSEGEQMAIDTNMLHFEKKHIQEHNR